MRHAAAVLAVLLAGCKLEEPFVRSNPFDPGSPYPLRLVGGPDTAYSIGDEFQLSVEREPPLGSTASLGVTWVANIPAAAPFPSPQLKHLYDGRYVVTPEVSSTYTLIYIGAAFNSDVVVWRTIYVGQRAEQLSLSCSATGFLACDTPVRAVGARVEVSSTALDARGNGIRNASALMDRSQVVIRDPSVMASTTLTNSLGTYHFTALAPGSTWVVVQSDRGTDSVRFVVTP
jgi:hypothetical protein